MSIRRLLVISLGNPGQLRDTFHSVGHLALSSVQKALAASEQPTFTAERRGKKSTLTSDGPKYTLLQSPTLMNVSGKWVAQAYKEYLADQNLSPAEVGLVLVHDELEADLGVVKVRDWNASHRGHNGVKDVLVRMRADETTNWARVSVGIGRPAERDRTTVSDFVLSKMSVHTKSTIEQKASRGLYDALVQLENKWERKAAARS
ncbi:peptidyl-tRNA hydrolase [Apodospora peruviana]|uniref:peptidyl-tRNA hydrolase n=1 Tax=Apodospora peruviana TaxID=516989 RepID=A0AAE0MCL4_9PEZI|nr:peptidyl-tRNA hydrolase [Apodospora peruviana]